MDECATKVILGKTVRAPNENAPLCMSEVRLGMGARRIASGRSPSIDTITTRRTEGAGVGVNVGEGVTVSVNVAEAVTVNVGEAVTVAVAVGVWEAVTVNVDVAVGRRKGSPAATGTWQASSRTKQEKDRSI
jgi:hypothetical protein